MESASDAFCFICNSKTTTFYCALSLHKALSSQTALHKKLGTILANAKSTRCKNDVDDIICKRCIDRLYSYDRLSGELLTAHAALRDLLRSTESESPNRTEADVAYKQEIVDEPLSVDETQLAGAKANAAPVPPSSIVKTAYITWSVDKILSGSGTGNAAPASPLGIEGTASTAAAQVVEQKVANVDTWPPATDDSVEPLSADKMRLANAAPVHPSSIVGAASTRSVVRIRRIAVGEGNSRAAPVDVRTGTKVETRPPAIEPIVEPFSVDGMLSACETANAAPASPLGIEGTASTRSVVRIRRIAVDKGNLRAVPVDVRTGAKVETRPPTIEPIVEPFSVDEMLSACETANAAPAAPAAPVDDIEMSADTAESDWADDFEWKLDEEETKPKPERLKCIVGCSATFGTRGLYLEHLEQDHRLYCARCRTLSPSSAAFEEHVRNHMPHVDATCPVCRFACNGVDELGVHVKRHSTANEYQCVICDKQYAANEALACHVKHIHMLPLVLCDICGRFHSWQGFSEHYELHSSENMYACQLCPQKFKTRGSRSKHKRLHTPEYECIICGAQPTTEASHQRHQAYHMTYALAFECGVCGARFKRKLNLELHEKRHVMKTGTIPCTMCHAMFPYRSDLKLHMKSTHRLFILTEKLKLEVCQ